jgi:WD40 repeat protein/energy-coupling factor transporter ATP-binding protein EcfA2
MPYPGLRPFTSEENAIFFGCDDQVGDLLDKLSKHRFIAVVGPSGCGKSSLVKAGLIPGIEMGFLDQRIKAWRIAVMRPGVEPMKNLCDALCQPDVFNIDADENIHKRPLMLATLTRGPSCLVQVCKENKMPPNTALLVVVDQFEEIFRFRKEFSIDQAEAFVNMMIHSARQSELPIYVIFTMRSDFLGDCALFLDLPQIMNDSQYLTPRLNRDQLKTAIEGPAHFFGAKVCPKLVNVLLNDMGNDMDQLPVLQHALMRMWVIAQDKGLDELNLDLYEKIGTLRHALSNHADSVFNKNLSLQQQKIAEVLFKALCQVSSNRQDTRRPVSIADVARIARVDAQAVIHVVNQFRAPDKSFITPPIEVNLQPDDVIDISHESLIRLWQRLKDWVKEESRWAEIYQLLENAAIRKEQGEFSLYRSPELDIVLDWKDKQNPSQYWAARYGAHFELAMAFLEESQAAEEDRKRKQKEAIEKELQQARERTIELFESQLTHAALHSKIEDFSAAKKILHTTHELDEDIPIHRQHARNFLNWYVHLMGLEADRVYQKAGAKLFDVAISPDGKTLAACGERETLVLFDESTGDVIQRFKGHTVDVRRVLFHPNGHLLFSGGDDRQIIIWSLPDGIQKTVLDAQGKVWALAIHPKGHLLASGGTDNTISLWDMDNHQKIQTLEGHEDTIQDLAFSPNGQLLASASYDKTARLWDVETFKQVHVLKGHASDVHGVAFHPNGKQLATSSRDTNILLWQTQTGQPIRIFQGHDNMVVGLLFLPAGTASHLVSASFDRTLRIWDTETGIPLRILQGHQAGIGWIKTNGRHIYSAANDGTVRRWPTAMPDMHVVDVDGEPWSCAISPDGQHLALGFSDGSLQMFSLHDSVVSSVWKKDEIHTNGIQRISFFPDGSHLITASFDNTAKLIQAETGDVMQTFKGHDDIIHAVSVSPNGRLIATASYDGRIGLFQRGQDTGNFVKAHDGKVYALDFDCTGNYLVSSGIDGKTKRWQLQNNQLTYLREIAACNERIMWTAFSPDGRRIVSVGRDQLIHVFDVQTSKEIATFVGHENSILRAAFTPDGGQVVSVSADATIRVWDIETRSALFTLRLPSHAVNPVPLWDFAFNCTQAGDCTMAVPLTRGRLVVYFMDGIFATLPDEANE